MAVNIGPKIGIDGEAEYRKELKSIIQETKTLAAETNAAAEAFENADDKEKAATDVTEKLNKQIEAQRKLVKKLEEGVQKSAEATGENSDETNKWKEQLAKAKAGLSKLESQTKSTTGEVKDLGTAEESTGKQTSVFGDVLKANLASKLIQSGLTLTMDIVKKIGEFFIGAVQGAAEYADEISTLAKTTGIGTDELQEYTYAAKLLDVELETITGALTKTKKSMASAKSGPGAAAEAFKTLGVAVTDENGELRDAETVFNEVIKSLKGVTNETERDALAMQILGKGAAELNPLIEADANELEALKEEAHRVGAVLDKETLKILTEVQDGFDRAGLTWDAVKKKLGAKIGAALLPDLQDAIKLLQDFADTGDVGALIDGLYEKLDQFVTKTLPDLIDKAYELLPGITKTLLRKTKTFIGKTLPKIIEDRLPNMAKNIGTTLGQIFGNLPELIKAGVQLAAALLKGLISAIPEFAKAFGQAFSKAQLSDEAQDMIDGFERVREKLGETKSAAERTAESFAEISAKQAQAEHWIEIFDELSKKTEPTAAETERLQTAVNKLNELFPELGLQIDEETGKWNLNTAEIRNNIEAIADRYKAEAYYAAAADAQKELAVLERERDAQQQIVSDLDYKIEKQKTYLDAIGAEREELAALLNERDEEGGVTAEWYAKAEEQLAKYGLTIETVDEGYAELNRKFIEGQRTLNEWQVEIDAADETLQAYDNTITGLEGDIEWFYGKADEAINRSTENANKKINEVSGTVSSAAKTIGKDGEEVGSAAGAGVAKGILSQKKNIEGAASAAISGAIQTMREVAQIQSPSKVTENLIGKNLALGVIEGWDDVMDPAKMQTAFTLTPAFAAMQSSMVTNTTNTTNLGGVSINVYAAEGMDINALTDAIMKKMQGAVNARKAVFA